VSTIEIIDAAAQEQDVIARERGRPYRAEFFPQFFDVQDEIDYYAELGRRAREAMLESPALAGRLVLHNSWAFWIQGRTARATLLNAILTLPFLLLVVIGAWLALRADRAVGLLLAGIVAFVIPHLTIIALARYHIPLIPLLAVLASYPLHLTCYDSAGAATLSRAGRRGAFSKPCVVRWRSRPPPRSA
jgi:hypothetical protein